MDADDEELVNVALDEDQRDLLVRGLNQWGGGGPSGDEIAVAMGFADGGALLREAQSLLVAIHTGRALSRRDWTRALIATEFAWVSDVVGLGREWGSIFGDRDEDVLRLLRSIQLVLSDVRLRGTLDAPGIFW